MISNKQKIGFEIEQLVKEYLLKQNIIVLQSNYFCKYGEIDLIGSENNILVFIEVRYRKNEDYGGAIASITKTKQSKIIRACKMYLLENNLYDKVECRFDVVVVQNNSKQNNEYDPHAKKNIIWLKNAFIASSW